MPLEKEERKILIEYRQEKALRAITEAKDNAQLGHWTLAANRLYYAVFHAASALLLSMGHHAKTHSGTIHLLGQKCRGEDMLSNDDYSFISRLQNMRQMGDYDDLFDWTEQDVAPKIPQVEALVEKITNMTKV